MTAPADQHALREALEDILLRELIVRREYDSVGRAADWIDGKEVAVDRILSGPLAPYLAAEAENTRLKETVEAARAKAEEQVAYWRTRQAAEKCLEDGLSEDGMAYTPIGDDAAWRSGYCNGRMSEADWWRSTFKYAPTIPPKENPDA